MPAITTSLHPFVERYAAVPIEGELPPVDLLIKLSNGDRLIWVDLDPSFEPDLVPRFRIELELADAVKVEDLIYIYARVLTESAPSKCAALQLNLGSLTPRLVFLNTQLCESAPEFDPPIRYFEDIRHILASEQTWQHTLRAIMVRSRSEPEGLTMVALEMWYEARRASEAVKDAY